MRSTLAIIPAVVVLVSVEISPTNAAELIVSTDTSTCQDAPTLALNQNPSAA